MSNINKELCKACEIGDVEKVKSCLDGDANPNYTQYYNNVGNTMRPLVLACDGNHIEIVKLLLDKGADVNSCQWHNGVNLVTPLQIVCQRNHIELIKILLNNGANVNLYQLSHHRNNKNISPSEKVCKTSYEIVSPPQTGSKVNYVEFKNSFVKNSHHHNNKNISLPKKVCDYKL
jgi:ankyrin repeat protein